MKIDKLVMYYAGHCAQLGTMHVTKVDGIPNLEQYSSKGEIPLFHISNTFNNKDDSFFKLKDLNLENIIKFRDLLSLFITNRVIERNSPH